MTLVQLEYIVALDTYRSFVVAAEKCFVTQPTLSMQIQKLEEAFGIKIFDRSKQPVVPTEVGVVIIEQARVILAESGKLHELIAEHKQELTGELKVGVIPTIAPYLLPKILSTFMEKYPRVQLLIWEYTTEQIVQNLKNGLLDCGILSTPLEEAKLVEVPLFYETFVAYVSARSHLYVRDRVSADDLDFEELWLLNEGHCMRNQILNICQQKKRSQGGKQFEYNTGSVETLKRMVDLNYGMTILPELSIADFSAEQMASVRHFRDPEPVREISLVMHRNHLKKNAINALRQEITDVIPEQMLSSKRKEIMNIYN